MPPIVTYHSRYARRDWVLFAIFVLSVAIASAAYGFALDRDEVRAARARAEYVATTLAERFANAAGRPGSDVATILAPLAEAGAPDLTLAIVEEHSAPSKFVRPQAGKYLGNSDLEKAGRELDLRDVRDSRMLDLVELARDETPGTASYVWTHGEVSAAAFSPTAPGIAAVVEGLRPRSLSRRPKTIAFAAFVMLILFGAGMHDMFSRAGGVFNLLVLVVAVLVVGELGKAIEPSLWRGMTDDPLLRRADELKDVDLVRVLSIDLPAAKSSIAQWGFKVASGACILYGLTLMGIFRGIGRLVRREALAYRVASPAFGLVVLLALVPAGFDLGFSLTHSGFLKYAQMLLRGLSTPTSLWRVALPNLEWIAASAAIEVTLALVLALAVSSVRGRFRLVYRTMLFIPWALPPYVSALLWLRFLSTPRVVAFLPPDWLSSEGGAFFASLGCNVWRGTSLLTVLALAAVDQIPQGAIDALRVEGVHALRRVRALTIPLLAPLIPSGFVLACLMSMNAFAAVDLVTGGAPEGATDLIVTRAYRWGFERFEFGWAAAWSICAFGLSAVLAVLFARALGRLRVHAMEPAVEPHAVLRKAA